MNKEIKLTYPGAILDYVDTKEHLLELFNYITNLQKKSEILEENNKLLIQQKSQMYNDLDEITDKIEKAIELINNTHIN